MPFFIYAKVTDGTASDAAELVCSLTLMSILVKCTLIGNFQGQMLIADIGAVPYIAIKSIVKPKSHGYPVWNSMFICIEKT